MCLQLLYIKAVNTSVLFIVVFYKTILIFLVIDCHLILLFKTYSIFQSFESKAINLLFI